MSELFAKLLTLWFTRSYLSLKIEVEAIGTFVLRSSSLLLILLFNFLIGAGSTLLLLDLKTCLIVFFRFERGERKLLALVDTRVDF